MVPNKARLAAEWAQQAWKEFMLNVNKRLEEDGCWVEKCDLMICGESAACVTYERGKKNGTVPDDFLRRAADGYRETAARHPSNKARSN